MSLLAKQIGFGRQPNTDIREQNASLNGGNFLAIQNTLNSSGSASRWLKQCTAYLSTMSGQFSRTVLRRDLITSDERRGDNDTREREQRQYRVGYNGCSPLTAACRNDMPQTRHLTGINLLGFEDREAMTRWTYIVSSFELHGGTNCSGLVSNGPIGPREIRGDGALTTVRTHAVCRVKRHEQKVMA